MSANDRLSQFKNRGKDVESGRLRRKEDVIELRKARKEEQLSKRRNIHLNEDLSDLDDSDNNNPSSPANNQQQTDIQKLVQGLHSQDIDEVFRSTHMSRKILSKERNPPIDQFIELNATPRLVQLLQVRERPDLVFEAAWALTNIASGNEKQTCCVVDAGACPMFIQLLGSSEANVVEQSVWALANIAGDGPTYRDMLISQGIVPAVTRLVHEGQMAGPGFLANVAWCLSNLCRNKNPAPPLEAVRDCLPSIKILLMHEANSVVSDACWSLSYISDGTDDRIQLVLDADVLPRLVDIMQSSNDRNLVVPALRTLGNIVTGSDVQTQKVIDSGALAAFRHLLLNDHPLNHRKEVAWALSNVTAGNERQVQAVVDAGLLPYLVKLVESGDSKTQKEATWAVSNLTCGGTLEQILQLVQEGVLPPLVSMLSQQDAKITMVALDAVRNILAAGDKMGQREPLCELLEELGLVDVLESLQCHDNPDIYKTSVRLIDEYWGGEENEDTGVQVTSTQDGQQFVFDEAGNGSSTNFNF